MAILMTVLVPASLALVGGLLLRHRETTLGYFGAGFLGGYVAHAARYVLRIDPIPSLGTIDPLIWMFGGTCIVVLVTKLLRKWWERRRGAPSVVG